MFRSALFRRCWLSCACGCLVWVLVLVVGAAGVACISLIDCFVLACCALSLLMSSVFACLLGFVVVAACLLGWFAWFLLLLVLGRS